MPQQELKLKIGADVNGAVTGVKKLTTTIEDLRASMLAKKEFIIVEKDVQKLGQYNREISALDKQIKDLKKVGLEGAQSVDVLGSSFNNAFSSVRKLALILPGIGIAGLIGVFSEGISDLASNLFKLNDASDKFKESRKVLDEALNSDSFIKASENVSELTINIGLAKQGLLDKEKVLNQYNETIGKTTGKVNSLDEAEQALVKNGPAYLQMILLQAAAHLALDKAAKKAVDAEIEFQDALRTAKNVNRAGESQKDIAAGAGGLSEFLSGGLKNEADAAKRSADKRVENLKSIAQDFQKQAADIATKFKFDFFKGDFETKQTKEKVVKVKKIKVKPDDVILDIPEIKHVSPIDLTKVVGKGVELKMPAEIKLIIDKNNALQQAKDEVKDLLNGILASDIISGFGNFGEAIGQAIAAGANPIQAAGISILGSIGDLIEHIGKALIEYGVVKTGLDKVLASGFLLPGAAAIAIGVGAVAVGALVKNSFKDIKKFADGGLAFGPTLGLIGEGRGTTRSNPEIIAPLDKLKKFIGGGQQTQVFIPALHVGYDAWRISFNRANKQGGLFS